MDLIMGQINHTEDRFKIMSPDVNTVGLYSADHSINNTVSYIVFAEDYNDRPTLAYSQYRTIDEELHSAINKIRKNPRFLVPYLEEMLPLFDENNNLIFKEEGKDPVTTVEGIEAVQEAIDYLNSYVPNGRRLVDEWKTVPESVDPMTLSSYMSKACRDHTFDSKYS